MSSAPGNILCKTKNVSDIGTIIKRTKRAQDVNCTASKKVQRFIMCDLHVHYSIVSLMLLFSISWNIFSIVRALQTIMGEIPIFRWQNIFN